MKKTREPTEHKPGVIVRTVAGTAGLAATLVRLSAGIVAVACLAYFCKDRVKKSEKNDNYFAVLLTISSGYDGG